MFHNSSRHEKMKWYRWQEIWCDTRKKMSGTPVHFNVYNIKREKVARVHAWPDSQKIKKTTGKRRKKITFGTTVRNILLSILQELHTPPRATSYHPPAFISWWLGLVSENRPCLCYSELSTRCGPQQGSLQPDLPPVPLRLWALTSCPFKLTSTFSRV